MDVKTAARCNAMLVSVFLFLALEELAQISRRNPPTAYKTVIHDVWWTRARLTALSDSALLSLRSCGGRYCPKSLQTHIS